MTDPFRQAVARECREEFEPLGREVLRLSVLLARHPKEWGRKSEERVLTYAHRAAVVGIAQNMVFGVTNADMLIPWTKAEAECLAAAGRWAAWYADGASDKKVALARRGWERWAKRLAKEQKQ